MVCSKGEYIYIYTHIRNIIIWIYEVILNEAGRNVT